MAMLMPLKKALEAATTRKAIVRISEALEEERRWEDLLWWVLNKPPGAKHLLLRASQLPPLHLLLLLGWFLLWLFLLGLLLLGLRNVLLGRHPQEMRQCLNSVVKVLLLWRLELYCAVSCGKQYLQQNCALGFVLFSIRICLQSSRFDFIWERFRNILSCVCHICEDLSNTLATITMWVWLMLNLKYH